MKSDFNEKGFLAFRGFYGEDELENARGVVTRFHQSWIRENSRFYTEAAINSSGLTGTAHLGDADRESLFKFIGSAKLMDVATSLIGNRPAFMNTQLFFDPYNAAQKNYWHRDPQYHLSVEEQRKALQGANVLHFRVPLVDEPGVEFIPGSHRRWDREEELEVRLERNGRKNHEDLPMSARVALKAGDLLVFSANMIHRGLYGMNRMALDILFCDPDPELVRFVDDNCLPDARILEKLEDARAFQSAIDLKAH